jgi:hypothetical protein
MACFSCPEGKEPKGDVHRDCIAVSALAISTLNA